MRLSINNRQKACPLDLPSVRRLARALFEAARRRDCRTCWSAVTLTLTDSAGIAAIHDAVFGNPARTDVVTVRYEPSPADPGSEGEIFINVQIAFEHPCRQDWTPAHEMALYIAHGFDHLTGADDATPAERRRMRRRELRWLRHPAIRPLITPAAGARAVRPHSRKLTTLNHICKIETPACHRASQNGSSCWHPP